MSISSHLLERAIRLWKSGEKQQARQILQAIIYNDRHNEAAWIWYVYSRETNTEKTAALESFLEIFPGHELAVKALGALQAEERQPLAVSGQAEAGSLPVETVDRRTLTVTRAGSRSSSFGLEAGAAMDPGADDVLIARLQFDPCFGAVQRLAVALP